jgi:hypothetical protein
MGFRAALQQHGAGGTTTFARLIGVTGIPK